MRAARRALLQAVCVLIERQTQARDQERDGQHDANVEQVDESFERVSGCVFDVSVTTQTGAAAHVPLSVATAARSSAVRSSVYIRVRVSVNANATVPTNSPIVVAANAVRRSVASVPTSP